MTAVVEVKSETRTERLAAERRKWIADAVAYMISIGLYAQEEIYDAVYLAEDLYLSNLDTTWEMIFSAEEAVDEELTYWGD